MQRSIVSRLSTLTLGAVMALAVAATDTAIGRAFDTAGRIVVDLYRAGALALYAMVASIPAPIPIPLALPHEPEGTAHQRTWLVPGNAYAARMEAHDRVAIEPGWRMCPST